MLRSLWSGEPVTHHGRFFTLDDVQLLPGACRRAPTPRPRQAGGPPLHRRRAQGAGHAPSGPPRRRLDALPGVARRLRPLGADDPRRGRGDRARPRRLRVDDLPLLLGAARRRPGPRRRRARSSAAPTATSRARCSTASRRRARPTRSRRGSRTYVDAGARHIVISPAAPDDTLEVVTLAAEEVLPRLTVPAAVG